MFKNRREILAGAAALSVLPMAAALAQTVKMDAGVPVPDMSNVKTAKQFSLGVMGPAQLSLETSQIAVTKSTNAMVKEFAGFELTEAIAVTSVLKDLGTSMPTPDANAKMILDRVQATLKGAEFDRYCIAAQYNNHVFLRDLATAYLKQSTPSNAMEMQGRHLAPLALATFTEHTELTNRISTQLTA